VAVGDFNRDGKLDLAVANELSVNVTVLLGTGTGSFGAARSFGAGPTPVSVVVGDLNGDGTLDLAVANVGGDRVSILLNTCVPTCAAASFGAATDFGVGNVPASVAVGDFNGDGKLDLAVANALSNTVSILLGTGTGSFEAATDFGVGAEPASVAVGDFTGDAGFRGVGGHPPRRQRRAAGGRRCTPDAAARHLLRTFHQLLYAVDAATAARRVPQAHPRRPRRRGSGACRKRMRSTLRLPAASPARQAPLQAGV
jgi:hypothetical protein